MYEDRWDLSPDEGYGHRTWETMDTSEASLETTSRAGVSVRTPVVYGYRFTSKAYCAYCDDNMPGALAGDGRVDLFECGQCGEVTYRTADEDAIMDNTEWDLPS